MFYIFFNLATALKDFLAKRLPPPIPTDMMMEVERVSDAIILNLVFSI